MAKNVLFIVLQSNLWNRILKIIIIFPNIPFNMGAPLGRRVKIRFYTFGSKLNLNILSLLDSNSKNIIFMPQIHIKNKYLEDVEIHYMVIHGSSLFLTCVWCVQILFGFIS